MACENVLLSDTLSIRDGLMFCEDVCIKTLQADLEAGLGTAASSPAFVYSKAQVLLNIRHYRIALEAKEGLDFLLGYALKVG